MSEVGELSRLETLPSIPFKMIIEMTDLRDLKSLRLASKSLRMRVEQDEKKLFKHWNFQDFKKMNSKELSKFSDEVKIVEGLSLVLHSPNDDAWLSSLKHLIESHPEMQDLGLIIDGLDIFERFGKCLPIIGHVLKELLITSCTCSDGIEDLYPGSLPVLETLKYDGKMSIFEVGHLLSICRSTIKTLNFGDIYLRITEDHHLPSNWHFPLLEEVAFFGYSLSETDLSELLNAAQIKVLKIANIFLTGASLSRQSLSTLTELHVHQCLILNDSALKTLIKKCPMLNILHLSKTQINGEQFSDLQLGFTPQIAHLELKNCKTLTDAGLATFLRKVGENIKVIKIRGSDITGEGFAQGYFEFAPKLEILDLTGCQAMTYKGLFAMITQLGAKLKVLNLSRTLISGQINNNCTIYGQTKLTELDLSKCQELFDPGFVTIVSNLGAKLKVLQLAHANITGENMSDFKSKLLPELEFLDLAFCRHITDTGLKVILNHCGNKLKKLNLLRTEITGEGVVDPFSDACSKLEDLNLDFGLRVTEAGAAAILDKCAASIRVLKLNQTQVTGEIFGRIAFDSDSQLEELHLDNCYKLTDAGLASILNRFGAKLRVLGLRMTNITGENFGEISGESPSSLESLDVSSCPELKLKGLTLMLEKLGSQLNVLRADGNEITEKELNDICFQLCPNRGTNQTTPDYCQDIFNHFCFVFNGQ